MTTTRVEWVNHASFVLRFGDFALLSDPWMYGTAFNDGWELVVPSAHDARLLAEVDAIWISHVHPDHFSPRILKAIDRRERGQTRVYFQRTLDQQVAKFCRGLGYPVTEVPDGRTVELADGIRLTVGRVPFYDSWSLVETPDARILNLNDCVINRPRDLNRLAKRVGPVDVLLTQFSYANWIGGPADVAMRREAAAEKLAWMRAQLNATQPKFCIPFASFIRFAHVENAYLNDVRNTVEDAIQVIEEAGVHPVVMAPGESWRVGSPWSSDLALAVYGASWQADDQPLLTSEPVTLEVLAELGAAAVRRLARRNNRLLLRAASLVGLGRPLHVRVSDLRRSVEFSPVHGLRAVSDARTPDVTMSSQSLSYTLRYDWGADTLSVNGRFQADAAGYRKLLRTFAPALLNNNGRGLSWRLLLDRWLVRRAFERFVLRGS